MRKRVDALGRFFFFCFLGMIFLGLPITLGVWFLFDLVKLPQFIRFLIDIGLLIFIIFTMLATALYLSSR